MSKPAKFELNIDDLREIIKLEGGIGATARTIGVDFSTVYRWTIGVTKPSGLAHKRLLELVDKYYVR